MKNIQTKPLIHQYWKSRILMGQKKYKKQKFRLKAKIYLTIVLPVMIALLTIRVLETYLRIIINKLFLPSTQAEDS